MVIEERGSLIFMCENQTNGSNYGCGSGDGESDLNGCGFGYGTSHDNSLVNFQKLNPLLLLRKKEFPDINSLLYFYEHVNLGNQAGCGNGFDVGKLI